MTATTTDKIDRRLLETLRDDLAPELELHLNESPIIQKSVEPPQWVHLLDDLKWWLLIVGLPTRAFFQEFFKEAGKDAWKAAKDRWKERAVRAPTAADDARKLLKLARGLAKFRGALPEHTDLVIGFPMPNDILCARYKLSGRDESTLAAEIALFVHHLPALEKLIEAEDLRPGKVIGFIFLTAEEEGSLRVEWTDMETLHPHERTLPLANED